MNWIQECIDIEYRKKFKLAQLDKTPVYKHSLIPNLCTSILNRFGQVTSDVLKKLIQEKNVFFDPNRNTNILEIWTTSDLETIEETTKGVIEKMKKNIENDTYEAKHAGNSVVVIGPGGKV
jgi:hypothetical protein